MKIQIINGPNLNLLGKRETSIYGDQSFEQFFETLKMRFPKAALQYYQSNVEGELINKLHEVGFRHLVDVYVHHNFRAILVDACNQLSDETNVLRSVAHSQTVRVLV